MAEAKSDDKTSNGSNLAAALNKFQSIAPTISKRKKAKIPTKSGSSYEYKYADLADIWDAIRKPLTDCGLSVVQVPTTLTGEHALKTILLHESGDRLQETMRVPADRDASPQNLGSAITYSKRYMLSAMLGLVTEDDDDGEQLRIASPEEVYLLKKESFKRGITTSQQFEDLIYQLSGKPSRRLLATEFDVTMSQIKEMENDEANG